jgi:hypothetical protein
LRFELITPAYKASPWTGYSERVMKDHYFRLANEDSSAAGTVVFSVLPSANRRFFPRM